MTRFLSTVLNMFTSEQKRENALVMLVTCIIMTILLGAVTICRVTEVVMTNWKG